MRLTISSLALLLITSAVAADMSPEAIKKRLSPIGSVNVKVDPNTTKTQPTVKTEKVVSTGEKIYNQYCMACHAAGIAGSPKFRDQAAWANRINKGLDKLTYNAVHGINAMPAKGTCMECSENDIREAVKYMLPQ